MKPPPQLSLNITERLITGLTLLALVLLLAASGWLWRWDLLLYDLQMGQWSRPPAEDILIVAIDERSLAEHGRWPWPRDLHARLIDILSEAGAQAIALGILFTEPDARNRQADRELIRAVAASGRVFLPVIIEEQQLGGRLIESIPMPELAQVAAGLGHMHMELDADGITRGLFLYEGLGQAFWPHLMLTMQQWLDPEAWPMLARKSPHTAQSQKISRHSYRLIPFSGPPGHYPHFSYSQVLQGDFLPGTFQDRIVLVGMTAAGLGDALPTPVSAQGRPMPGVEINANILDLLRSGDTITRVGDLTYLLVSGLLVIIPFLLYPRFSTRLAPLVTLSLFILLSLTTLVLLHALRVWFPPAVAMLGLLLSYPLWSWRRLEQTVAYLKLELAKLHAEQQKLPVVKKPDDLASAIDFLKQFMPLEGWAVYDKHDRLLQQGGEMLPPPYGKLVAGRWWRQGAELWTRLQQHNAVWRLGLRWPRAAVPRGRSLRLLEEFAAQFNQPREVRSISMLEQVEKRIWEVQQANARLSQLRRFIDTALGQMDDGLLVVDSLGRVVLANPRAALYLGQAKETLLVGKQAPELLKHLEIRGGHRWNEVISRLLIEGQPFRCEAMGPLQRELYLQLQPLEEPAAGMFGMIINLSDIGALKQTERTRAKMLNFLSHDIRSPITSLLSLTQSKLVTEGTAEQLAREIRPLALRSLKLADDFLQQARAEAADATSFSDTDFVAVIHNAMGDIYPQAQQRGIRLVSHFEVEEAWLSGNVALLERAMTNLLVNAVKFSPDNGVIRVNLARFGAQLECCVQDQGPGIPVEQREQIFIPFQHGEEPNSYRRSGVGLGLSFVKVVAEKHNGSVALRDTEQGGAIFCLRLPCEPEET
jgi:CHASE2 domain-containing sensor protein/signal transduction histidine kinase